MNDPSLKAFKRIKCQRHRGEVVGRIEIAADGRKLLIYSMRTVVEPGLVAGGGRRAEPKDEVRLWLDDPRIIRGRIPYIVTWCPRCRGELVIQMDWLLREAKHSGTAVCPTTVLDSSG